MKTIIIDFREGLIDAVFMPDGVQVIVRDYDCDFYEIPEDQRKKDKDGFEYHLTTYEN